MSANRWKERKSLGQFQPRSELTSHQQTLLAAVPKWKYDWVRPSSLKPHQSPKFLIKKWVLDTSSSAAQGTEEEMRQALKTVVVLDLKEGGGGSRGVSGDVTPAGGPAGGGRGGTPGPSGLGSGAATGASTPLLTADVPPINPAKPPTGPAPVDVPTITGTLPEESGDPALPVPEDITLEGERPVGGSGGGGEATEVMEGVEETAVVVDGGATVQV